MSISIKVTLTPRYFTSSVIAKMKSLAILLVSFSLTALAVIQNEDATPVVVSNITKQEVETEMKKNVFYNLNPAEWNAQLRTNWTGHYTEFEPFVAALTNLTKDDYANCTREKNDYDRPCGKFLPATINEDRYRLFLRYASDYWTRGVDFPNPFLNGSVFVSAFSDDYMFCVRLYGLKKHVETIAVCRPNAVRPLGVANSCKHNARLPDRHYGNVAMLDFNFRGPNGCRDELAVGVYRRNIQFFNCDVTHTACTDFDLYLAVNSMVFSRNRARMFGGYTCRFNVLFTHAINSTINYKGLSNYVNQTLLIAKVSAGSTLELNPGHLHVGAIALDSPEDTATAIGSDDWARTIRERSFNGSGYAWGCAQTFHEYAAWFWLTTSTLGNSKDLTRFLFPETILREIFNHQLPCPGTSTLMYLDINPLPSCAFNYTAKYYASRCLNLVHTGRQTHRGWPEVTLRNSTDDYDAEAYVCSVANQFPWSSCYVNVNQTNQAAPVYHYTDRMGPYTEQRDTVTFGEWYDEDTGDVTVFADVASPTFLYNNAELLTTDAYYTDPAVPFQNSTAGTCWERYRLYASPGNCTHPGTPFF